MGRRLEIVDTSIDVTPQPLTNDPGYRDEWPQWSPDASSLLFVRVDAADQVSLWTVPAAGGSPQPLLDGLSTASRMPAGLGFVAPISRRLARQSRYA